MTITGAGDRAVFVDLGDVSLDALHGAAAAVRGVPHTRAWIVGHRSLLGTFDPGAVTFDGFAAAVGRALEGAAAATGRAVRTHAIPVSFAEADAPDLPLLLEHARLTRDEFLRAVRGLSLRARFLGFLRGFAYLEGVPASWQLPRRRTSRARVPAGAFGIAGAMAGFYPAESPGGWNIIGRTAVPLWDVRGERPNVIDPGDVVRIVPTMEAIATVGPGPADEQAAPEPAGPPLATVRSPGQLTLVVPERDERRSEIGLPPGGPFDPDAAAAANGAVGNPDRAPVLECALVGPTLAFHEDAVLSWFGAEAAIRSGDRPVAERRLFEVEAGDVVAIGPLVGGSRGVLAVRGGVADPAGRYAVAPGALRPGDVLGRGSGAPGERARLRAFERTERHVIRALAGPHDAGGGVLEWLARSPWTVSPSADRTGVRLEREGAHPDLPGELPSCGMQFGTVQCHPNGDLVVMGPDHPVTGGYLQPVTVISADLWKLGQLRPGDAIRWMVTG
jgi:KipI family sensor histidine kinase inhibitor